MNIRLSDYDHETSEAGEVLWEGSFQEFVDDNEFEEEEVDVMNKELNEDLKTIYVGGTGVSFYIETI